MGRTSSLSCVALALAALASGCELVTGISDKTLSTTGVGVPCARQPSFVFCDDFDSEPSFGAMWDWHQTQPGGAEAFDTTDFATGPRSARFTVPSTTASSAQLGKQGITLGASLRLAFDLRLDVDSAASLPEMSVAQVLTSTSALSINYVVGPGAQASLQLFDTGGGAGPVATIALLMPPLRVWTNIVVRTDWKAIAVDEDGATLTTTTAPKTGAPGSTEIILGVVYVNPVTGASPPALEVDDVVLGGS